MTGGAPSCILLQIRVDAGGPSMVETKRKRVPLPQPIGKGPVSLEEALASRRSLRDFTPAPLTLREIAQLLWSAQGVTDAAGHRTAPSAGATYPIETYVATVEGLYHYDPAAHEMSLVTNQDLRPDLSRAALVQEFVQEAPAVFVLTAVRRRTERHYGEARGTRYVHMDVGHAAQNLLLQAVSLGLGGVPVGAFRDAQVRQVLGLSEDQDPLYLIPVGRPRRPR